MPDPEGVAKEGADKAGSFIQKRIGPLPLWAWAAGIGVAFFALRSINGGGGPRIASAGAPAIAPPVTSSGGATGSGSITGASAPPPAATPPPSATTSQPPPNPNADLLKSLADAINALGDQVKTVTAPSAPAPAAPAPAPTPAAPGPLTHIPGYPQGIDLSKFAPGQVLPGSAESLAPGFSTNQAIPPDLLARLGLKPGGFSGPGVTSPATVRSSGVGSTPLITSNPNAGQPWVPTGTPNTAPTFDIMGNQTGPNGRPIIAELKG